MTSSETRASCSFSLGRAPPAIHGGRRPGGRSCVLRAPHEHPDRFRLGGLRPLSMGAAIPAAGRERYGLHSRHPDRFRLGGLRPLIEAPPSGPPVGSATGSTLSILPVFAWAGSARSSKRRHPGGRSGARDTATQRRRDAHRPALKRGVARAPRAGVGCERSHGWRSEAGSERTEATMAGVSVRLGA